MMALGSSQYRATRRPIQARYSLLHLEAFTPPRKSSPSTKIESPPPRKSNPLWERGTNVLRIPRPWQDKRRTGAYDLELTIIKRTGGRFGCATTTLRTRPSTVGAYCRPMFTTNTACYKQVHSVETCRRGPRPPKDCPSALRISRTGTTTSPTAQ